MSNVEVLSELAVRSLRRFNGEDNVQEPNFHEGRKLLLPSLACSLDLDASGTGRAGYFREVTDVGDIPESRGESPESRGDNPESLGDARLNPESLGESPESLGESPESRLLR